MTEIFAYGFMQKALLAGLIVSIISSLLGVYVVLKRLSFIGVGISHSAFGGVALGFFLGLEPVGVALLFSLAAAWGIGWVSQKGQMHEDTAIGIFFAAAMALGIMLIGLSKGYTPDLFGYLFGSILSVTSQDLWLIGILGLLVLVLIFLFFKELLFLCFDEEVARAQGLPVRFLYFLLLSLMSATIVLSIKVVGIILVSALLVIPAASSHQLASRFRTMVLLSVGFGLISTMGGLVLSYYLNLASGATIVLLSTVIFFLCLTFSPKRRQKKALP
jgi:zinc transport system permease protein